MSRAERRRLMGILRKTHSSFSYILGEFNVGLADNIKTTLGFEPLKIELDIDFIEPEPPQPEVSSASDYPWRYLSPLLPMIIFRRLVERQFREQISPAVKQNLSRFAGQWEELMLKSIRAMRRQAIRRIKDELATLQVLFHMDRQQMHELKAAAEDLRNRSAQLLK